MALVMSQKEKRLDKRKSVHDVMDHCIHGLPGFRRGEHSKAFGSFGHFRSIAKAFGAVDGCMITHRWVHAAYTIMLSSFIAEPLPRDWIQL